MGGCCYSSPSSLEVPPPVESQIQIDDLKNDGINQDWVCPEFSISDLLTATKNFSSDEIVSSDASTDIVYKGQIENLGFAAVKKLKPRTWPSRFRFAIEAQRVWELKHKRVVKFFGYGCDKKERLLVAEFLPKDTLAKRLFDRTTLPLNLSCFVFAYSFRESGSCMIDELEKSETMEWGMRLRVAYCIAEALDFCSNASASYSNLSAYTILFDKDGDACLSCFGLLKENEDDQRTTGSVNSQSVIYRFGTVLVNLLTGKQIPPSHAPEMINGKNVIDLMDPNLEGKFSAEEATVVLQMASRCLQYEDRESLNTKDLVATLEALQHKPQDEEASSSGLEPLQTTSEIPSVETKEEASSPSQLSPLGEACSKRDLNVIHEILVKTQYEDDKDFSECSLEEWLPEKSDVEADVQLGHEAFENKDFASASQYYEKVIIEDKRVIFPSVYARRCLSSLFCKKPEAAFSDANKAIDTYPDWPTGHYLMSLVLAQSGMPTESAGYFEQATLLEQKSQGTMVREEES
ncbi:unnamed protein product [Arabis nemorensis]|uniref:Serine/threonine-protein kinase BSK n=1 Tax=Arabis nemorensis TaxID=586526 RepID=A0A565CU41_9BRAS|nr:unnamed protein product [Arabis nemorensis]